MESVEIGRLLLVSLEFQLVLSVAEGSDELAGGFADVHHALYLLLGDVLIVDWGHLNSVFNADSCKFVLEVGMLDQEFTDLVAKMIDDIVLILLSDLLKELNVQHREDLEFIGGLLYNLVNALGLHIDRFTHLLN